MPCAEPILVLRDKRVLVSGPFQIVMLCHRKISAERLVRLLIDGKYQDLEFIGEVDRMNQQPA